MLPINADGGWHCTVNGEERTIKPARGQSDALPLDAGNERDHALLCAAGNEKGCGGDGIRP